MNYKYENVFDLRLLRKANKHRYNSVCVWKQMMLYSLTPNVVLYLCCLSVPFNIKTIASATVFLFSFNARTDTVSLDKV